MVLMRALDRARTRVCEPIARVRLDVPATALGAVLGTLSRLTATVYGHSGHGDEVVVDAALTAANPLSHFGRTSTFPLSWMSLNTGDNFSQSGWLTSGRGRGLPASTFATVVGGGLTDV